jgi:uncharacterized protein (TIGR03435 family)
MIKGMWKMADSQITGAPDWIDTEHYDIDAKTDHPATLDQLHEMFRCLITDRFQLRFHIAKRLLTAYAMTVAKSGAKLERSQNQEPAMDVPMKPDGSGARVSMPYLAWYVSQGVDAPVVDETGLAGFYDFNLSMTTSLGSPGVHHRDDSVEPALVIAIREQLGLRLQSRRIPVEVMVVDHVARPGPN